MFRLCQPCKPLVIGFLSLVIGHSSFAADVASPLSPDDAQKLFQLADSSLRIELAAAEPACVDPVAIRFDEDGRMWVVEMRDYPLGNPTGGEPLSRIRVLEDRDGDGQFETATTFADKLLFVTGLQPWKGGVFVTLSGAVTYMKDTDGDGRADLNETWFEGFAELNSQLRANHPRLGLDNWIYVANGLRGGKVVNRKLDETEPINISGMDFRFDPLTGKAEAVSGNGQFGLCFDDWGNRFNCSNRNPVRHVVIEDRYLRASGVTVPAVVNDVAASGEQSRIFPISRAWTTSNLHAGQFTAACGVYIYRGDLLPAEFKGNAFTCDPTGNLIHREIMQPAGPTFSSRPAYEGKEFLASPDEWFRPVNMELGPDGALYVVDMYRCVIEHPDFVPDELKRRPDLRLGDDRGRIWRIVPNVGRSGAERPESRAKSILSKTSSDNLIPLLEHSNAWQRETAQRLILERQEDSRKSTLRAFATKSQQAQGRARAVWALAGMSACEPADVLAMLSDDDALVRRQGLLVGEVHLKPVIETDAAATLLLDNDPTVRFQARLSASACGAIRDKGLRERQLANIASDADDLWLQRSILLSLKFQQPVELQYKWMREQHDDPKKLSQGRIQLIEDASQLTSPETVASLGWQALLQKGGTEVGLAILRGWLRSQKQNKVVFDKASTLIEIVRNSDVSVSDRTTAVSLLGYTPEATVTLVAHSRHDQPQAIRIAAINALARIPGGTHWRDFLGNFSSDTPPIRRAIIDGMLANSEPTKLLLDAIEAGRIKASEIDLAQAKRLTSHRDASIKDRAAKLFEAATPADRAKALADYQTVLQISGDAVRGQVVFEKNCAACHRIAGLGVNVAPDISDSRTKKFDQLLADIIQPNRAIDNNYLGYSLRTLDGTVATGILTAETATSVTLRQQGGKDAVIARAEIDELRSSGQSLMPEGLERQIPHQDMADLLSFIKNWRYLDGRTPLSGDGK